MDFWHKDYKLPKPPTGNLVLAEGRRHPSLEGERHCTAQHAIITWIKTKTLCFWGMLGELVQSVRACSEDVESQRILHTMAVKYMSWSCQNRLGSSYRGLASPEYLEILIPVQKDQSICLQGPNTVGFAVYSPGLGLQLNL